jgi:hypothetical protein
MDICTQLEETGGKTEQSSPQRNPTPILHAEHKLAKRGNANNMHLEPSASTNAPLVGHALSMDAAFLIAQAQADSCATGTTTTIEHQYQKVFG